MLTLYYKPTCPFCQRVLGEIESMGIKMHLKDISADPVALETLIELGGKRQVPYLVDGDRDVSMYESLDIIAYLEEHYKNAVTPDSFGGVKVQTVGQVCESCE